MADTYQELLAMIGKDIEFLPKVETYCDFDAGMRATVTDIAPDGDDGYQIRFTFAKFEDHNTLLEKPLYYDAAGNATLTSHEAGHYTVEDYLYVEADGTYNWRECVKVLDAGTANLLNFFATDKASQPDITYIAWLEALALAAMPHLKS